MSKGTVDDGATFSEWSRANFNAFIQNLIANCDNMSAEVAKDTCCLGNVFLREKYDLEICRDIGTPKLLDWMRRR